MYIAGNICVIAMLNQMAIKQNSLGQNAEMAEDYKSSERNYKELMKIKMGRVSLGRRVTAGLTPENVGLYLQYYGR